MHYLVSETNQKMVYMKTLFYVLAHGHQMLEYKSLYELFVTLQVSNNLTMHWSNGVGQILTKFMYDQIQIAIIIAIQGTFIACSCDELTIIDNGFQIYIHAYVVGDWFKWPILVCVGIIVDGFGSNNLTKIIMNNLLKVGG